MDISQYNTLNIAQEQELNSHRGDIRQIKLNIQSKIMSALNGLNSQDFNDRYKSMETLYNISKKYNYSLTRFFSLYHFYVIFHFYIHQIHYPTPDMDYLNYAIYLLQFPGIIHVDYDNGEIDFHKIQFPYESTENVESLAQPDSIQFLLRGIRIPKLSENCFRLLTMIIRNEEDLFIALNEDFFNFIQENPDSPYGELFYLYFIHYFEDENAEELTIQKINKILIKILNCSNEINILNMIKSMNFIYTNQDRADFYSSIFEEPYQLLIEKLPNFILSQINRIIVQSLIFVSTLDDISDQIIIAVFNCLPSNFKKMHNFAFTLVEENLSRIVELIEPSEIAEIIQNCFHSSQYQVKKKAYKILDLAMQLISLIDYIDVDSLLFFLDDPSLAPMALPLIISIVSEYEKSGDTSELLDSLSNNIEQILELIESEDEQVAEMAAKLNTMYESMLEN